MRLNRLTSYLSSKVVSHKVELDSLGEEELLRILVEPETVSLSNTKRYLKRRIELIFTDEALKEVASLAAKMNREMENIGQEDFTL